LVATVVLPAPPVGLITRVVFMFFGGYFPLLVDSAADHEARARENQARRRLKTQG
jgi:hypothetical protein